MWVFCLLAGSAKKVPEQFSAQDELVEILNDFKNNVFSIAEIEMLVQNWQKRNDVQQSFKDKQVMMQTLYVNSLLYF
jgi:DNA-binding transcriptional MerR regulator